MLFVTPQVQIKGLVCSLSVFGLSTNQETQGSSLVKNKNENYCVCYISFLKKTHQLQNNVTNIINHESNLNYNGRNHH